MDREEAIETLAIAFGQTKEAIREQAKAIERLNEDKQQSEFVLAKLHDDIRILKRLQPRKSYLSPYAKFDKYHKKKRK